MDRNFKCNSSVIYCPDFLGIYRLCYADSAVWFELYADFSVLSAWPSGALVKKGEIGRLSKLQRDLGRNLLSSIPDEKE